MYLKKVNALKNRLTFKLTFLYIVLFITSSGLALSIFYLRVSAITLNRTDTELTEEINEYSQEENLQTIVSDLTEEVESEDSDDLFFRLLNMDGSVILSWNTESFETIDLQEDLVKTLIRNKEPIIRTIESEAGDRLFRSITGVVAQSAILQIGLSLDDNEKYLSVLRHLFMLLIIPLCILAGLVGWLLARKAMRGVEEVTQTAIDISMGSFDKRVDVKSHSTEIDGLAKVFNGMVDRLQAVISSMKEMNNNIAHDFRSPLARIRVMAEMSIMGEKTKQELRDLAVNTLEECDNLINIVNTTMDIAETEVGFGELSLEKIKIDRLINQAIELFDHIAAEKNIKIKADIPESCTIYADKNKLQRMITNLLENAIKYTHPGGRILISVTRDEDRIIMKFKDNGIGIDKEDLSKIFNRFYRCDKSRSEEGIGLGLSLVKAIVEASGGTIRVISQIGKGSQFIVSFPKYMGNIS